MKFNSILALVLLAFLAGCVSDDNQLTTNSEALISAPASSTDGQDCFDFQLETWYNAFQHYQSAGYDMQSADQKAVAEAAEAYKTCASL